jgi:hypothetical protein
MSPSAIGCSDKARLIEELSDCHKRILILYNGGVATVLIGNFGSDPEVEAKLGHGRELRSFLLKELRQHVSSHQC